MQSINLLNGCFAISIKTHIKRTVFYICSLAKKSTPINGMLTRVLLKVISSAPRLDLPRLGPLIQTVGGGNVNSNLHKTIRHFPKNPLPKRLPLHLDKEGFIGNSALKKSSCPKLSLK